ncbi:MAG: hypothetical protein ABIF40_03000 [archaeon]
MNKKGAELSLNFLIIAALALIVLILVVLFFTGGFEKIFTKTGEVTQLSTQERLIAEQICKTACEYGSEESYNNPEFSEDFRAANINDCEDLLDKSFEDNCGECSGGLTCVLQSDKDSCLEIDDCEWASG